MNKPLYYVVEGQKLVKGGWQTYNLDVNDTISEVPIYHRLKPGQAEIRNKYFRSGVFLKNYRLDTVITNLRYGLNFYFQGYNKSRVIYSNPISYNHLTTIIK